MALSLSYLTPLCTSSGIHLQKHGLMKASKTVGCMTAAPIVRRTANYQPPIWDYDYVQSLSSNYLGENYVGRADKLKGTVRMMLDMVENPLTTLQLVDALQRLGISYHFEDEISRTLETLFNNYYSSNEMLNKQDLSAKALGFRLLRQHGYHIPQEIFNDFKDETGNFKESLCEDIEGMLNLYEASYLSVEDESILDEAREFTTKHLKESLKKNNIDQSISVLVSHALGLPLHWSMPRLESRWFIEVYERKRDMNPTLLELGKLDFNMVQAMHQEDLKYASRWWKSTCWGTKLSFARDRLMENFMWAVGKNYEPRFGNLRRTLAKVNALLTAVDDVYDVYGTLDELDQFTDYVNRWDINAIEQLPDYMKICFLGLYNSINEIAYGTLTEQGILVIPYLKKVWADVCKAYLVEAKWYNSGYTPTLEEYMNNAWISVTVPVMLTHAYFSTKNNMAKEALQCLEAYPNLLRYASIIVRFVDDFGTSSDELKRGDVPKSIQCYMHESGASEEDAREHIKHLISETWKKLNKERLLDSPFSRDFIQTAMNLVRMSQSMYQYGDGHASQNLVSRTRMISLFIDPIQGV